MANKIEEKEWICSYHEYIKKEAKEINKIDTTQITTLEEALDIINQIKKRASIIYKFARLAKTAGVHMEKRLKKYREAIENLGFVRKKRGKKKNE